MTREELEIHIAGTYAVEPDRPWAKYPDYLAFRHAGNRKWFAALLSAPRKTLGLPGEGTLDVVNVKCDPLLIGSFRESPGVCPAYHMNKASWLSVSLEEAEEETIRLLLDMSFDLTAPRAKKRKGGPTP